MAGEQRRLAAIIAADVVGYSRLMGRDESGTLARLREHRKQRFEPILERYGGRIVKLTGDGALAEFPSAVGALSAAIAFQQAMAEINRTELADTAIVFRIGLHLGDLIVEENDLYGDGVNIAARLESEAPPGGIVVSGDVHNAVAGRLKTTFEDMGDLRLKNIERPIPTYRATWDAADWPAMGVEASLPPTPAVPAEPSLTLPDKPSIAVLPFTNMSGDPEQEYFTDGITEDIITELSRFRSLFVIARNSSFSYKGKSPDVRQVGRELGVRYVLEGSIRRAGGRIRITAQLIEAGTGSHIWAERYDRALEDVFEVQEEVTRAIVSALAPEIEATEQARALRRRPDDVGAYEIALKAWADVQDSHHTGDRVVMERAVQGANKALAIDPNSVLAHQSLCLAKQWEVWHQVATDNDQSYREAIEAADRAISLDGANARSHALRAYCSFTARDFDAQVDALIGARRAYDMNANDTYALYLLGCLEASVGDTQRAIDQCQLILRLNPRDSRVHTIYNLLAFSCSRAKRFAEGADWAARSLNVAPRNPPSLMNLISCLVGMGDIDKARSTYQRAQALYPQHVARIMAGKSSHADPQVRKRSAVFMRIAAGLEDPSAAEAFR
ncbi:MAG: adenylate/guanylate cyclase domain-containing protein [Reyranellaceae bacterium]